MKNGLLGYNTKIVMQWRELTIGGRNKKLQLKKMVSVGVGQ